MNRSGGSTWARRVGGTLLVLGALAVANTAGMSAQDASTGPGATRTVDSAIGPVEIPAQPQRIVALLPVIALSLLDLGVTPVGTAGYEVGEDPLRYDRRYIPADVAVPAEMPSVGLFYEPNLEAIRALQPDLIIQRARDANLDAYLSQLQDIAPTFIYDTEGVIYGGAWRQTYEQLAAVVGKEAEAASRLADIDQRVAVFQERMGDRLDSVTVSLVQLYDTGAVIEYSDTIGTHLYQQLGIKRPAQQEGLEPDEYGQYHVSNENLDLLDADVVFVSVYAEDQETLTQFTDNPVWRSLGAYRSDSIHVVGNYFQEGTIWHAHRALDDFTSYLLR